MRIAYVGNYKQKHCTEVHLAKSLENLGHQVVRLQEDEYSSEELGNVLDQLEFDLFLFTRTWGETVTLDHLAHLRERKIPSASYHLDLYVGLSRKYLHGGKSLDEVLQSDPFWRTDFVFTPDGDPKSQEVFERNGVKHYYMKPGVFEPECYMTMPRVVVDLSGNSGNIYEDNVARKYAVVFVGGGDRPGSPNAYGHPEWNYRNELIAWLYDAYRENFTKFGHPQTTIRNDELNQLYADSKIVIGDSVCIGFNHEHYWSDRVYETIGRGGFLIHPYIKGLEEEFTDGETIIFYEYGNFDQLKQKIDYYLEHDDERECIRRAGHELVKSKCTYSKRLQKMLEVIDIKKMFDDANGQISAADVVPTPSSAAPIKINLGAGSEPKEGWINVDWVDEPGINIVHNLLHFPWPFDDHVADEIMAIDVLEHMPNYTPKFESTPIKFIEECHRILQPDGVLTIQVPHWNSPNMWIDPTHVRGFDPKSFDYFDPDKDFGKWYGYYSPRKFVVTTSEHNGNITFKMRKI